MDLHKKLSIIVELTKIIRDKQHTILDIFNEISNIASEVTHSERSSLFIYNRETKMLETKVAQGVSEIISLNLDRGIAGWCATHLDSIIENDVNNNPHFDGSVDRRTGYTTHKLLAVPIFGKGQELLGVLQVLNKIDALYNEDDKDLLIIVSELVASVIEDFEFTKLLEEKVAQKTHQLQELNTNLEAEVARQVQANRQKDALMFSQSKLAAMGEMFDAVAHQWKQPLSIMSIYTMEMQLAQEESISYEAFQSFAERFNEQIEHLTVTLTEFRSFFRSGETGKPFSLRKSVDQVLHLIEGDIKKHSLNIHTDIDPNLKLLGKSDEFKHVILNLINNAKDAFIENGIKKRDITIEAKPDSEEALLQIKDNAGGIPQSIIHDLFKANITTKEEGKGTGIGLYMSEMIVNKMRGSITVQSDQGQTLFTLRFPQA